MILTGKKTDFLGCCSNEADSIWVDSKSGREVVCKNHCNLKHLCPEGHFCTDLTLDGNGMCVEDSVCPESPFNAGGGVLTPKSPGVAGSQAVFRCPPGLQLMAPDVQELVLAPVAHRDYEILSCSGVDGWVMADGSGRGAPLCVNASATPHDGGVACSVRPPGMGGTFGGGGDLGLNATNTTTVTTGTTARFTCQPGHEVHRGLLKQGFALNSVSLEAVCLAQGWFVFKRAVGPSQNVILGTQLIPCIPLAQCKVCWSACFFTLNS